MTLLIRIERTDLRARELLEREGEIFAVFDARTQDSGNPSYGVRVGDELFFVKTAGDPQQTLPVLSHGGRVELLRNAIQLARSVQHTAMPPLRAVVESADGPLVVYDWVDGELLRSPTSESTSPMARFRALPAAEAKAALDAVFALHVVLANGGWVACDFYDGALIYDFSKRVMHVVDLDNYRQAPFENTMGRMFGSTRFMAPEEHQRGATIDERTTVFTMGRTIQQLFTSAGPEVAKVAARACEPDPALRYQTMAQFYEAWAAAAAT